jgi:hypothetical protein
MRIGGLAIAPMVLLTVGCFQGQRTFKVNADGSGTIVDTVKLGEQAKGMIQGMEQMDQSPAAEKKAKKQAKYAEAATALGEGVTFVSTVPSKDGGEVTTYAFKDITKVHAVAMPNPDVSSTSKEEPMSFQLAKNAAGNTVLTVVAAPKKPAEAKPGKAGEAKPEKAAPKKPEEMAQEIAMMKGMLGGLKIKSVVAVNGLVKTSSPNVVGSAVTLMEVDFDQLDAAALQKMAEAGPGGPPTPEMMRGIKGIKVSDDKVTIEFTGRK